MADQNPPKRWNLFARELEDVLAAYQLGLGHLDDRAGIHREKVRRLKQSLLTPISFPVLNVDEIEQVSEQLQLSYDDILRLRAALLATSIEKTLMDRIPQEDALLAAEQILPILLAALREQMKGTDGLGAIKGGDGSPDGAEPGDLLEPVSQAIDDAQLAFHMSFYTYTRTERIERVRYAQIRLEQALASLDEAQDEIRALSVWSHYQETAQQGLAEALERLEDLTE